MKSPAIIIATLLLAGCPLHQTKEILNPDGDVVSREYGNTKAYALTVRAGETANLADKLSAADDAQKLREVYELKLDNAELRSQSVITAEMLEVMTEDERRSWFKSQETTSVLREVRQLIAPFAPQHPDAGGAESDLGRFAIQHEVTKQNDTEQRHKTYRAGLGFAEKTVGTAIPWIYGTKMVGQIMDAAGNRITGNTINNGAAQPQAGGQFPCQPGVTDCAIAPTNNSSTTGNVNLLAGDQSGVVTDSGTLDIRSATDGSVANPTTGDSTATGDGATSATTSPAGSSSNDQTQEPLVTLGREASATQERSPTSRDVDRTILQMRLRALGEE